MGSKADTGLDFPLSVGLEILKGLGPLATENARDFGQHNWWVGINLGGKASWKSAIKSHAEQSHLCDERGTLPFFFSVVKKGDVHERMWGCPSQFPPPPWLLSFKENMERQ